MHFTDKNFGEKLMCIGFSGEVFLFRRTFFISAMDFDSELLLTLVCIMKTEFLGFLRMLEEICGAQFHGVYNLLKIAATLKGKFGFLWTEEPGGLKSIASQSRTLMKQLGMHAHIQMI